jgi:hypothetical protein
MATTPTKLLAAIQGLSAAKGNAPVRVTVYFDPQQPAGKQWGGGIQVIGEFGAVDPGNQTNQQMGTPAEVLEQMLRDLGQGSVL